MKLKTIVASLVALGLSAPVLAAQPYYMDSYQLDVMRDQVNKVDIILDQNQPGGFDQPCGWTCRINVSGWINTDAYLANKPPVFLIPNPNVVVPIVVGGLKPTAIPNGNGRVSDLILNNANLFFDARVNNWVTANASLVYSSLTAVAGSTGFYSIPNSLLVYHPVPSGNVVTRNIDTAYATIGNFQVSPIYFRVGKEYVPFGQYDPYAFVQSENLTQLISEINAPTAQLGFIVPSGFYGSLYTFAGNAKISDGGSTRRIQNGGIDLGYQYKTYNKKANIDAGYIANILDSNFLSSYYFNSILENSLVPGLPNKKVPAYDVNMDVQFGPFDANGHYIAMTQNITSPIFLGGLSTLGPGVTIANVYGKPKIWGLEAGFTFPVKARQSRVAVGYQSSTQLSGFLPKRRIYADYLVNMAKWFDLGFAVFQDKDYGIGSGDIYSVTPDGVPISPPLDRVGTGNKSTVGQLRASIKFA